MKRLQYILIVLHQAPVLLPIFKPNYLQTRKQIINDPALVLIWFIAYSVLIWFVA